MDRKHGREPPNPEKILPLLAALLRSERASSDFSREQMRIFRNIKERLRNLPREHNDTGSI